MKKVKKVSKADQATGAVTSLLHKVGEFLLSLGRAKKTTPKKRKTRGAQKKVQAPSKPRKIRKDAGIPRKKGVSQATPKAAAQRDAGGTGGALGDKSPAQVEPSALSFPDRTPGAER